MENILRVQLLTTSRLKRGDLMPGLVLKTLSLAFWTQAENCQAQRMSLSDAIKDDPT